MPLLLSSFLVGFINFSEENPRRFIPNGVSILKASLSISALRSDIAHNCIALHKTHSTHPKQTHYQIIHSTTPRNSEIIHSITRNSSVATHSQLQFKRKSYAKWSKLIATWSDKDFGVILDFHFPRICCCCDSLQQHRPNAKFALTTKMMC